MLNVHITAIFFAVAIILLADHEAFSWVRGKKETLSSSRTRALHALTWSALVVLITTGIVMFWPMRDYLLRQPLFIIKLLFVAVLIVNAVLIGRHMHVALTRPFVSLSTQEKIPLLLSGFISTFSWISVIILGLYLFY